jgi:hypothetical protein
MLKARAPALALAVLFAIACIGVMLSYYPSPGEWKAGKPPQTQADANQHKAPANQRGAEQSAAGVKIIGAEPQTQGSPAHYAHSRDEKPATDWWMVGVVGLVGLLQLAAFIVQAKRLGQTIGVMKDTAERQLRAYVSANKGSITIDGTTKIKFFLRLRNSGQTPAYKLSTKPKPVIYRPPGPLVFDTIDKDMNMGAVIGPGGVFKINAWKDMAEGAPDAEAARLIIDSIDNGAAILYVHGRADYEDVFEKTRTLYFRFKAVKLASGRWALQPEAEGNYEKK